MTTSTRRAFTFFELLVVLALLLLLLGLMLPAIGKVRQSGAQTQSLNNLKQIALACHNYLDTNGQFPPGTDANHFSAAAYLLPYLEQQNLFNQIDFKKPVSDKANAAARRMQVKVFLSPGDPRRGVTDEAGATNYLFNAGSKAALADNDGVFYEESKTKIQDITDGTSNTVLAGETLKGDGATKAQTVQRQHVRLTKDDLKGLNDDSGVEDFKDNKHIAGDRCSSWMDGRFLQGTFTGTRATNDPRPDVSCGGAGGLSALRSLSETVNISLCDGSARVVRKKLDRDVWKVLTTRNGGEVTPEF